MGVLFYFIILVFSVVFSFVRFFYWTNKVALSLSPSISLSYVDGQTMINKKTQTYRHSYVELAAIISAQGLPEDFETPRSERSACSSS